MVYWVFAVDDCVNWLVRQLQEDIADVAHSAKYNGGCGCCRVAVDAHMALRHAFFEFFFLRNPNTATLASYDKLI